MKLLRIASIAILPFYALVAQEPEPNASPSPSPGQVPAHVRVLFAVPSDQPPPEFGVAPSYSRNFQIRASGGGDEPQVLVANPYPFMVAGYQEVRPGRKNLSMVAIGNEPNTGETNLASEPTNFASGGFYTIAVTGTPQKPSVAVYDDVQKTPDGVKTPSSIRFFNFLEGVTVEVKSSEPVFAAKLPPGTVIDRPNLPAGIHVIETIVSKADGESQSLRSEINTGETPHVLFSMGMDIYGRTVPFIMPAVQTQ